jgi:hypothetical protein
LSGAARFRGAGSRPSNARLWPAPQRAAATPLPPPRCRRRPRSLLKTPRRIEELVSTLVAAVGETVPVSVKLRSGFHDTSLFEDNLLAAQAGGAAFVTLHPRTKRQAYTGGADWELIACAKALLDVPVVCGRGGSCAELAPPLGACPVLPARRLQPWRDGGAGPHDQSAGGASHS